MEPLSLRTTHSGSREVRWSRFSSVSCSSSLLISGSYDERASQWRYERESRAYSHEFGRRPASASRDVKLGKVARTVLMGLFVPWD